MDPLVIIVLNSHTIPQLFAGESHNNKSCLITDKYTRSFGSGLNAEFAYGGVV